MKKTRKLITGKRVPELSTTIDITISTKCPKKWALVDMETGEIWVYNKIRKFKRASKGTTSTIFGIVI